MGIVICTPVSKTGSHESVSPSPFPGCSAWSENPLVGKAEEQTWMGASWQGIAHLQGLLSGHKAPFWSWEAAFLPMKG